MYFPKIGCEWLFMVLFPPSWDLHCHALPVDACRVERIRWLNHQVQGLDLHSIRQSPLSRLTYIRILCFYWGEWIWMNLITCWLNDGNEETSWIWTCCKPEKGWNSICRECSCEVKDSLCNHGPTALRVFPSQDFAAFLLDCLQEYYRQG